MQNVTASGIMYHCQICDRYKVYPFLIKNFNILLNDEMYGNHIEAKEQNKHLPYDNLLYTNICICSNCLQQLPDFNRAKEIAPALNAMHNIRLAYYRTIFETNDKITEFYKNRLTAIFKDFNLLKYDEEGLTKLLQRGATRKQVQEHYSQHLHRYIFYSIYHATPERYVNECILDCLMHKRNFDKLKSSRWNSFELYIRPLGDNAMELIDDNVIYLDLDNSVNDDFDMLWAEYTAPKSWQFDIEIQKLNYAYARALDNNFDFEKIIEKEVDEVFACRQ